MKIVYLKITLVLCALFLSTTGFAFEDLSVKKAGSLKANLRTAKISKKKIDLKDVALKNVEFGFDNSFIKQSSYTELNRVAKLLKENDGSIQLSGHADSKGPYVYNWHLSKKRADAVKAYLVKMGADEQKIAATEFGDTKPIASNQTASGRKKNRRVELAFL